MPNNPLTVHRMTRVPGSLARDRLIIRGFKTPDCLYKFMAGPENYGNQWRQTKEFPMIAGSNIAALKPGTYAFAGGTWHNVKKLDATVLAHV